MAINDWPESERSCEKLLNLVPQPLFDGGSLVLFLKNGSLGQCALELARALLRFGSMGRVLNGNIQESTEIKGVDLQRLFVS